MSRRQRLEPLPRPGTPGRHLGSSSHHDRPTAAAGFPVLTLVRDAPYVRFLSEGGANRLSLKINPSTRHRK
jgi:hypothetical protein